jgi:5-methylcytosine-specific restriction endonuclease McrA
MMTMTATLLLNGDHSPLRLVTAQRAIVLVFAGKAEVLEESEEPVRSERMTIRTPKVIRLVRFVKIPYRARLPLTRRNLLTLDGHRCAYCPAKATTIDHVIPRSRGGLHRWENGR